MTLHLHTSLKKIFVACCLVFIYNVGIAQIVANFSVNSTQSCVPAATPTQFIDQSTGNPTTWNWDFGDGTTSNLRNPLKTYITTGIFSVTLTVSNSLGSNSLQKTNYITALPVPVINFSASPQKGCSPFTTTFTDLSTSGSGNIVGWLWRFGDGTESNLQNPSYTYTDVGNYDVFLYVTTTNGCGATLTQPAYIQVGDTVQTGFDTTTSLFCQLPKSVQFTSPVSSIPLSYLWNFGDGNTSTQVNPLHNYTSAGTFTVKLTANNSYGCTATTTKTNLIKVDTVITDFTLPTTVCPGSAVGFTNVSVPSPLTSHWDFGDGTNSSVFSPTKTFAAAGNYNITLTDTLANGCIVPVTKTLTVQAKPTVAFTANITESCKPPLSVVFTSTTIGATTLKWDFGDGNIGTGTPVSHIYGTTGSFTVKLFATNANGCMDSLVRTNYIQVSGPSINIGLPSFDGCQPFAISPVAIINSPDPVVSYLWTFGDGSPNSTSATPSHNYPNVGSYTISLSVTTVGGCNSTVSQTIRVGTIPTSGPASTNISPNPACAGQPVVFLDKSAVGQISFWDFGDNTNAASQNAVHNYAQPGTYTIIYTVDNNGCKKNFTLNNFVTVLPPVSSFTYIQSCTNIFNFVFNSTSSVGAVSYAWDFGDNATAIIANPTHTYASTGNFKVRLITTNQTCSDTIYQTITINQNLTTFAPSATTICKNSSIVFTAHYRTPAYASSYNWDFGDGTMATVADSSISHSFANAGIFSIRLIVQNIFGCADTVFKQNMVTINGPTASFAVSNPLGCKSRTVVFNDSSKTDGHHPIISWKWDFGDGSSKIFTSPPFNHTYLTNGNFTVKLSVTDAFGCVDSIPIVNAVTTSTPLIGFKSADTISCPLANIQLIATNPDVKTTYTWFTGTGLPLVGDTVFTAYPDSGIYTIKLVVKDGNNCVDSLIKTKYISIKKPSALFSMSDSASVCYSLNVKFINESYFYKSIIWDFGNGTTSTQSKPYVNFVVGNFNVKLKVTSLGGCSDSLIKTVNVYPGTHNLSYSPFAGCQPLTVNFKFSTPTKGSYVWDYNDGTTLTSTDSISSRTYTQFGPYLPRVTFIETSGCIITFPGTDTITVFGVKANFGLFQPVLCGIQTENFFDSSISTGIISYHWNFGDGASSNQQSPTYNYPKPGIYSPSLIVSSGNCADTLTKKNAVTVNVVPNTEILGDSLGCPPFKTIFSAPLLLADTSTVAYNWDFGNGQTSSLINPPTQTYVGPGIFLVRLHTVSTNGCIADTSKTIVIDAIPNLNAGNDTAVCFGLPVTLHATGANSYKWLPPTNSQLSCTTCASPIASLVRPSNTFIVQDTTVTGCTVKDSVTVKYLVPYSVFENPSLDSICDGQSIQFNATGAQTYTWSPITGLDNPNIPNPIATPTASVVYNLVATDTLGCQVFTKAIPITVFPVPTVNAGLDTVIMAGSARQLIPTVSSDVVSYLWTPAIQLSCSHCANPIATPKATTTYRLTVTNDVGCSVTDDVTITVLCNNNNVFFPNLFSPNGDGVNDVFYPRGTGLFRVKSLRIFNRWGDLLFSRSDFFPNDISQGWNGKAVNGNNAPADVYVYIAEIYCDNNTLVTINGNVTVVY